MPTTSQAPSEPPPIAGLARLAAGSSLLSRTVRRAASLRHWVYRLVGLVVVLGVLWELFLVGVGIATTHMWFDSVHDGSVYTTMIVARVVLFVVFAVIAGLVSGLTFTAIRRMRPRLAMSSDLDTFRWTFQRYEQRVGKVLTLVAVVVPAVLVGRAAASGWQTALLWQHATPAGTTDPVFHNDISFYLEVFPFHAMVTGLLLQAVTYGLWIAVIAGYWYGLWRLRRGKRKITRGMTVLTSLLVAAFCALKAYAYWLSRYNLTTSSRGPVTGSSYTDVHAGIPSRYVLVALAALCAIALLVNVGALQRVRVLAATLVVLLVGGALAGAAWPSVYYRFVESPSAAKVDLPEIARNMTATRKAFGLSSDDITNVSYHPSKGSSASSLVSLAGRTAQISLNDPNQVSPAFNVLQQLRSYYGFKSTLDVDHYELDGRSQDVVIGARELQSGNLPRSGWVNQHLVYTHGYGVVAAPTTKVDPTTESPVFLDGGIPAGQQIPVSRPQIYFGQAFGSGSYAIVGQPKGSTQKLEFDHPGSSGSASAHTTYSAHGGIPVGSIWRRLLFAVRMHSPNILFSNEINSASQLLTVRNPRARVAAVAPWLTLDGDVYPAVVDGHIEWIVDGYTTSSSYPNSQQINLHNATNTTLVANGSSAAQSSTKINYMRNSVKAVVDAYTGKVTLYSWNQKQQPDPLLKAWEGVFPGLIKPQSSIPSSLLSQLRYPTDLFNVQRTLLAKYHVTSASGFYSGNDFWTVPSDPTYSGSASQPSHYLSMSSTGYGSQRYSLSTPMVTLNGRELASYISVDAQPGPDYGKMTILNFPSDAAGESPSQVQNDIESDTTITEALTLQRGGNSQVVLGDLEAVPLAGRILYVEPVYTRSKSSTSFPVLRHVIALYGNGNPSFEDTLGAALKAAITSGLSGSK